MLRVAGRRYPVRGITGGNHAHLGEAQRVQQLECGAQVTE
jgi:hypothetical protein